MVGAVVLTNSKSIRSNSYCRMRNGNEIALRTPMIRRLLPIVLFALMACVALQASPLTVYFTGNCSDCTGFGVNGTVNASITFAPQYFYNINGTAESNNLAYGDLDSTGTEFIGQTLETTAVGSFVYDGSNKQAPITASNIIRFDAVFGWDGLNPFPGPQSFDIEWGSLTGISWDFNTVLNSADNGTSGTWNLSFTDNRPNGGGHQFMDKGTNASWSFSAPPPSPVPEPATWAEMIGGLGLLAMLGFAGKLRFGGADLSA